MNVFRVNINSNNTFCRLRRYSIEPISARASENGNGLWRKLIQYTRKYIGQELCLGDMRHCHMAFIISQRDIKPRIFHSAAPIRRVS